MKQQILGILGGILICASSVMARPVAAFSVPDGVVTTFALENASGEAERRDDEDQNKDKEAGSCGASRFLGMKPWYDGLCQAGSNEFVQICEPGNGKTCSGDTRTLSQFVWRVVLNVLFDITLVIGYIAAAMVIYGGYLFMMSQGDPSKAAKGKKTLTTAIIGLVISLGASVFVNTISQVLKLSQGGTWADMESSFTRETLNDIFSWAYAMAGVAAVGFIIKSGVEYMISTGDLGKTRKATHGLIYSVVGLIVVILASVITSFIIGAVGGAT